MKRILVAVDGFEESDKALALAIGMCADLGSDLIVLNVVQSPYAPSEPHGYATTGVDDALLQYGEKIARSAAAQAREAGVHVRWRVESGSPADVIDQTAASLEADLVVVGRHERGFVPSPLHESVSTRLLHLCKRPVLVTV